MGSFYRVIPPFSTRFTDRFYVFDDQTVSALNLSEILGFISGTMNLPQKFVFPGPVKQIPSSFKIGLFIKVADLPKVLSELGWNPEDLKKLINPENLLDSDRPLQNIKKRDREETDDLIKLFAKRYITENPEKVREVIVERLIGQDITEFLKNI